MKKILLMIMIVALMVGTANSAWRWGTKEVQGRLVYYDVTYPQTWLDVIGPDVVKYVNNFVGSEIPITTTAATDPPGWLLTAITGADAATEITAGTTHSGEMQVLPDATENDGFNLAVEGEAYYLETGKPLYFGARLKMTDADQSDLIIGLCITDTEMWGGVSDGVYFSSADETATASFTCERNDSINGSADTAAGTLTESYTILEFYYDGATTVKAWFDGTLVATHTTHIPNDEALTFVVECLTGEGVANGVVIDWVRIFQIR